MRFVFFFNKFFTNFSYSIGGEVHILISEQKILKNQIYNLKLVLTNKDASIFLDDFPPTHTPISQSEQTIRLNSPFYIASVPKQFLRYANYLYCF